MVGGGDHGTAIGIDLCVMTQVGASLEEFQFGIMEYLVAGERIIETICGEVIHGTTVLYITVIFKETGEPGITPIIGISQKIVSLHIAMMEDCMKVDKERLEQEDRRILTKVPQLGKERLEQVGIVLQVLKSIAQVKPLRVTMLQQQKKKRNEV
jgi:predicted house-cleaning noncanonical NTP pyrophosphatase (MazG superfamily)